MIDRFDVHEGSALHDVTFTLPMLVGLVFGGDDSIYVCSLK